MGVGMQIAYFGFAGSARIEAEASVQLMRLGRFDGKIANCLLVVEALHESDGRTLYDARLDLLARGRESMPNMRCTHANALVAIRHAFDVAEALLLRARLDES
ncbi:hypothetical protein WS67_20220 [Burkholderia singularis]|uniref:Cation transport ATPase n=1 Tax=Burkholderia singularis TaxID=1503053 RepID=A0A118DMG5_9BURK|nr:hypothetical protein [Burkholderia singularis]KVE24876.1 hypothetical protein WS67_20220 [Burkholderia singularis]